MRRLLLLSLLAGCGGGDATSSDARTPDATVVRADAALAPCGLPEPGRQCADATAIARCDGTSVVTETCASGVCGDLGAGPACLALPMSCGASLPSRCSGPVLTRCNRSALEVIDCGVAGAECRSDGSLSNAHCGTPCEEADVDGQGRCEAGKLVRCGFRDGHYQVDRITCPTGTACTAISLETSEASCAPSPECDTVGVGGSCAGASVIRCVAGVARTTDCAASGQVCAWAGEAAGFVCAAATGTRTLTGVVRYERRTQSLDANGALVPRPARGVGLAVILDGSDQVLATGATADDGSYTLRYDASDGAMVHVLVVAAATSSARPLRVMRTDGLLHGFAGPSLAVAESATSEVLITDASGVAGAFSIFDTLVTGMDALRLLLTVEEPVPLLAVWSRGYDVVSGQSGAVMYIGGMFLDDDSMDEAVLLHELGHYVEMNFGRTSNPRGAHFLYTAADPRLAWSEGWATYWSAVVRGDPRYRDSNLLGGFEFSIETDDTKADPARNQRQDLAENTVAEMLWDLGDAEGGDDDPARGGHGPVVVVQTQYLRGGGNDRGVAGVDLVDFLDGYLALRGATACPDVKAVAASRTFPYDFAGPVPCAP